jgi:hypothetical protein
LALCSYQDTTIGGTWHHCKEGCFTGDAIELTAAVKQTDPAGATHLLAQRGLLEACYATPDLLADYLTHFVDRRRQTNALWQQARQRFREQTVLTGRILNYFGTTFDTHNWDFRGGRYLGLLTRRDISRFLTPDEILLPRALRDSDAHGWEEAVVVAGYDLPGRISSFLFLLWHNNKPLPYCRATGLKVRGPQKESPPGVFFAINTANSDEPLSCFLDVLTAIRLQLHQFEKTDRPLPIVGIWPASPALAGALYRPHCFREFWAREATGHLFRHAAALDANIVLGEVDLSRGPSLVQMPLERWLALHKSRPWRDVLEEELAKLAPPAARALLEQSGFDAGTVNDILGQEGTPFGRKVRFYYGRAIEEDADGWWLAPDKQISNTLLAIDTVWSSRKRPGRALYQGRIEQQGTVLPFLTDEIYPGLRTYNWCYRQCLTNGLGLPLVTGRWKAHLFELAALFGAPRLQVLWDSFGWDPALQGFALPGLAIGPGGIIKDQPSGSRAVPCATGLAELMAEATPAVIKRTLLAVLHNILAPYYGFAPLGFVFSGRGYHAVRQTAEACHCPVLDLGSKARWHPELYRRAAGGSWPVCFLEREVKRGSWQDFLFAGPHNCIMLASSVVANLAVLEGGWHHFEGYRHAQLSERVAGIIASVLPDFLMRLLRQSSARQPDHVYSLRFVSDLWRDYLCERLGNRHASGAGGMWGALERRSHELACLEAVLKKLLGGRKPVCAVRLLTKEVRLPFLALDAFLEQSFLPRLNLQNVFTLLEGSHILRPVRGHRSQRAPTLEYWLTHDGWPVDKNWWLALAAA